MPNPDLIPEPFAQSGDKNTIPLERAITDPIYRASWKAGFPPDTRIPKDIGGEAPDGLDFNGVLNILSQAVVFLQKGNAYQFDAIMAPYPIGALVRSNDNLTTYQSTVPNNSNNPNNNMTGWRVYNGSGFIVDNLTTNDSAKALSAAQGKVLQDNKLEANRVGAANGVASLDANTKVPIIQLPNASTTAIGVSRFANTAEVANKANVVAAVTPKNIQDMFVGGFSENDSVTLPSGHILQWGVFTTVVNQQGGGIPQYVNFPKSFTSKVFSVSLSVDALATSGLEVSQLGINEIQLNHFSVYSNYAGKCMFFAIGY
jgi:hypothetical protein